MPFSKRSLGKLIGANPVRDGSFTDASTAPDYDLSAAPTTLTDVSWSIGTSVIHNFGFSDDGLNMYASDYINSRILFQPLATAYDPSDTAAGNSIFTVDSSMPQMGLTVSPDGTKAVWDKNGNGNIGYTTFSTAWDASSGATASNYNLGSTNRGYSLDETGTVACYSDNGTIYRQSLSTPWDPSTGTAEESMNMVTVLGFASGYWFRKMQWINSGNSFLVMGHSDGTVVRVDVTSPYTFTGATVHSSFAFESNGASDVRSFNWANDELMVYDYNGGTSTDLFRKTSVPSVAISSTDRTTSNVGVVALDEAGPEANSGVPNITSTDIGPNYILSSEDIPTDTTNWVGSNANIQRANSVTVGGMKLAQVYHNLSQSYGRVYQTVTGLSLTDGSTATLSVYVKEGTSSDNHALRVDTAGNSGGFNFVFKFVNGVPTKDATHTLDFSNYDLGTETIEDVGDGRWRISVPFTNNSGSTQSTHVVHCYATYETANTDSVYFGGVQLVEGSVAGDYAKTTTTTVNTTVTTVGSPETRELTQMFWGGIRGRDVVTGGAASIDVLVVGAGSARTLLLSNQHYASGGNGGSIVRRTSFAVGAGTSYAVTVGTGATSINGNSTATESVGSNGGATSFGVLTAAGGVAQQANHDAHSYAAKTTADIDGTVTSYSAAAGTGSFAAASGSGAGGSATSGAASTATAGAAYVYQVNGTTVNADISGGTNWNTSATAASTVTGGTPFGHGGEGGYNVACPGGDGVVYVAYPTGTVSSYTWSGSAGDINVDTATVSGYTILRFTGDGNWTPTAT